MTVSAIDIHTHFHTGDRARTKATATGKTPAERHAEMIDYYRSRDMAAVVFDVDRESQTGQRSNNDEIIDLVQAAGGRLVGFAAVDPWRQQAALQELERAHAGGLRGLKVQPITQHFDLNDRRFYPLWDFCQEHDWPLMVHTGTTAVGAGTPGGGGFLLRYGRPVPNVDDVAAHFPRLRVIAAHFAWPWHLELMAVARHKSNVYVDLSGWAPKLIPQEVLTYCDKVIPEQFLFGSDYPMLSVDRWIREFEALDLKDSTRQRILYDNAAHLLGFDAGAVADAGAADAREQEVQ